MEKVKATRDFTAPSGSRLKGDRFDYDMHNDPERLRRLGYVESVAPKPAPEKGGK